MKNRLFSFRSKMFTFPLLLDCLRRKYEMTAVEAMRENLWVEYFGSKKEKKEWNKKCEECGA